jgi:hypothetical protein
MADIRTMHVYFHDEFFVVHNPGVAPTLQSQAERVIGRPAAKLNKGVHGRGYTYTVLWFADGLDGFDDLDDAVALATSMAHTEGRLAQVGISDTDDDDSEWNGVCVFAIGPNKRDVEKASRER